MTLIPAYGRDYKTAVAARADWEAGKDFIIADISNPWDGKPINKQQADFDLISITLRFNNLTNLAVIS